MNTTETLISNGCPATTPQPINKVIKPIKFPAQPGMENRFIEGMSHTRTIVAAAQSTTSFIPPLGNDKSKVLTLNLRNRLIFRAADEADAVQAADFLGKKRVVKRSWGHSAGRQNVNYSETRTIAKIDFRNS